MKQLSKTLIQKEFERRKVPSPFSLDSFLFSQQLQFVRDPEPFKTAVCSRRSGKTVACAGDLVDSAIRHPGSQGLYLTLSKINARGLVWKEIKKINKKYGLGGKPNEVLLTMTFPNDSEIQMAGAKDAADIENVRGKAFKKAYIDEAQAFRPHIKTLIDDVIAPTLIDHNGSLILIGTPGPVPTGYFHECASSSAWSHHAWTFFDNPFVASGKHQEALDKELRRRGVSVDDPSIQREWFGKWVLDSNSLWIKYDIKASYDTLPTGLNYIMGIDLGHDDADALAVLGWTDTSPETYLVEELVTRKQGITELVTQIETLRKKYDIAKMVCDTGGLGKKIAEELIRRHQLPIVAADKTRKFESAEFLNDGLRTGRFRVRSDSLFAQDSRLVEKDMAKTTPDKLVLSTRYHSDIIDAVLYAYKESPAFAYQEPEKKPVKGTPAWFEQEVSAMEQAAEDYFRAQKEAEEDPYSGY